MEICCKNFPPSRLQLPIFPSHVLLPQRHPIASLFSRRRGRDSTAFSINLVNQRTLSVAMASASASASTSSSSLDSPSGAAIVREFYDRINRRDVASVAPLVSDDCVYEDLVFAYPFVGRKAILDFFKKFTDSISSDLQFVIDDISGDDSSAIGVTWHLEWRGKTFPFSKGCSFYRLEVINGKKQIVYGRDCVEPALKPGEISLVLIRAVTSILEKFPKLADSF